MAKKLAGWSFKIWVLEKFKSRQAAEEVTEDISVETSASEQVPVCEEEDVEEAVPDNTLTLDLAEGSDLSRLFWTFMTWTSP